MQKKRADRAVLIYICLAAVLILGIRYFEEVIGWISRLWNVMLPLVMGLVIAYVLNLILVRVERVYFPGSKNRFINASRRGVGIVVSILLILGIFALVGGLVIPELIKAFGLIGRNVPVFMEEAAVWLEENSAVDAMEYLEKLDWDDLAQKAVTAARSGLGSVLGSTISVVGSVVGGVVNFFIGLIFGIYILFGKEKLSSQLRRILSAYVSRETVEKLRVVFRTANETFSSFIIGQCTEAVILGTLCTVGMLLLRFPYAPMIGAFVGATALIPIVGAYLGAAVGAFMILTVDPLKAVLFVAFIVVLQQLEGNLVYPKVVGSSIGLPGIWVLAAVTVGGGLMGIGGMLLGVPVAATAYKLLGRDVNQRNAARAAAESRRGENRQQKGTYREHAGADRPRKEDLQRENFRKESPRKEEFLKENPRKEDLHREDPQKENLRKESRRKETPHGGRRENKGRADGSHI